MHNNQTGIAQTYIGTINEDIELGKFVIKSPIVVFDPDIDDVFVGALS